MTKNDSDSRSPSTALLALFFIGSGFSALAYQVILSRYAQLIVGATAYAISALLVAFMLGMSAGAALGGRWADRTDHPLRVYAIAEGAIGLYCISFPVLFPWFTELYLSVVPTIGESTFLARNLVRFALGVGAFVLPTFFMGITTPAFARAVASHRRDSGAWLARLYGWNTFGAALGALTTAYLLIPKLGLVGSMLVATVINFSIAILAYRRSVPVKAAPSNRAREPAKTLAPAERVDTQDERPRADISLRKWLLPTVVLLAVLVVVDLALSSVHLFGSVLVFVLRYSLSITLVLAVGTATGLWLCRRGDKAWAETLAVFLLAAFASGYLSFALEIIWTHLLAILLGNSVYAFGLMLGSLLLGLAIGSVIARRLTKPPERARNWLGASLALAGLFILLTLGLWDEIPAIFLLFAQSSPSFALMEAVRFAVALLLMLLPTAAFGITFPLTLHCATEQGVGFGEHVGKVYAVNTMGAVLGALSGPYLFLPSLGSLESLKVLSSLLLLVGGLLIFALATFRRKRLIGGIAVSAVLWVQLLPVEWDFNALNMAAAIYLGDSASEGGTIIYRREDATGGLTSVVEDREVRTLLTNGKFQGDNSEEIPVQHRAANIPTLFTAERERALVIGLGTGVTLAALTAHGFEEVVCAEPSASIIEAASQYFGDVNGDILNAPNVRMIQEDGRSVLLESPDRYDVITVEVSSIWFAGVGAIYSTEFYELASSRLRREGVLLQWFPIHHLSARNLFIVVNTVRAVFPYVSLWTHRHQAFVVASNEPLRLDLQSVRDDQQRKGMEPYLRELPSGSPLELLSDLVVTDTDIDRFLESMSVLLRTKRRVVSTDTWPTIEYETPKDVLENFSYFQNRATFQRFRSTAPFAVRGKPTARERALWRAAFTRGWNDPRALSRLAEMWNQEPALSDAASQWLFDELTGEDAFGADFGSDPVAELRDQLDALRGLVASAGTVTSCEPMPSFVSRVSHIPLHVTRTSGESLNSTLPKDALDGIFDPELGKGWRVRPDGRPVQLDVGFEAPTSVASVRMVVRPVDGAVARARLLGRDENGAWHPLASASEGDDIACQSARVYQLSHDAPKLTGLRIVIQGEGNSFRIALHELWASKRETPSRGGAAGP